MDINLKFRNVFKDLFSSEKGLLAYTLYSRYDIRPTDAVEFMNRYKNEGFVTVDDELRIKLTTKGRECISGIIERLQPSKDILVSYIQAMKSEYTVGIFEPYLPETIFYEKYIKTRETGKKLVNRSEVAPAVKA